MSPRPTRALTERALSSVIEEVVELRLSERYAEAKARTELLLATELSSDDRHYLLGELAHLHYYFGEFALALQLLSAVGVVAPGVPAARMKLAESVNLLALNEGNRAYSAVVEALLMLRVARPPVRELVAALTQLAHVESNRGRPREAIKAAETALRHARGRGLTIREKARAEYAVGFARMFAGEPDAIDHFFQAESLLRDHSGPLWQWITFCAAAHLRDQGWPSQAELLLAETPAHVAHERAWFAIRAGDPTNAAAIVSRCNADERPYARTVIAAARTRLGRELGPGLDKAVQEFQRGGLDHWRWGALWIAAGAAAPAIRRQLVHALLEELGGRGAVHWGFFDPELTERLLAELPRGEAQLPATRAVADHVAECRGQRRPKAGDAVVALKVLTVAGLTVVLEAGLTMAEIKTLVAALQAWLNGTLTRTSLAASRELGEATIRNHMHGIRAKLGITGGRGGVALVAYFADRRLLTSSATADALIRLTGKAQVEADHSD